MQVAHFYHVYCAGEWQQPVSEHLHALDEAKFDGPITVGLVGPKPERELVADIFRAVHSHVEIVEADSGFEQVTIHAAHKWAKRHDGAVMYAHAKGAAHPGPFQTPWRRSMTMRVISAWREHARVLSGPWVDAIGCHWLIPDCYPDRDEWSCPMFAGNFWIARCDYLRRLKRCDDARRGEAEVWIGSGRPSVLDLVPGKPSPETCLAPVHNGRLQVHVRGALHPQLED